MKGEGGAFEGPQEGQCGWNRMSEGELGALMLEKEAGAGDAGSWSLGRRVTGSGSGCMETTLAPWAWSCLKVSRSMKTSEETIVKMSVVQAGVGVTGAELELPPSGENPHSYHLLDEGSGAGPLRATLHI